MTHVLSGMSHPARSTGLPYRLQSGSADGLGRGTEVPPCDLDEATNGLGGVLVVSQHHGKLVGFTMEKPWKMVI